VKHALHAEWSKLRTLPAQGLVLAGIVLLAAAGGAWHPAAGRHAAQILAGVLGVMAITGEYGTGMIQVTFTAMPRRTVVLAAKAILLGGLTALAGLTGWLVGVPAWPAALICLLGLGIGAAVREAAAAIGILFAVLYLVPGTLRLIADPDPRELLARLAPGYGDTAVTAAWAIAALLAGGLALRLRDV
jgi:ABC-2 type transport system permease protein